ncbi:MAG: aminotransferase class V-fold PLP-dependent enzyme [Pseudomonadota bacterium]|nr:MAG: aminotransferase class V-fold PLP-dependent enzyme [Pseudomonadota bacterium]
MDLKALIASEFQLDSDILHLNHAAVAPWPTRTVRAIKTFAEENAARGSQRYAEWIAHETELRQQLADLIGAPGPDDIALLKNTSEGLSIVAHGLDWREGDNVVISDQEFPSNRIVWESLQGFGVEVRHVDLAAGVTPEQSLADATDRNTRLLAISSVQYATGLRMHLAALGAHCQAHGILVCVDAIQSIGAVRTDVAEMQADFVVADGHKWMLGPEGLALFYCRPELRERLTLRQYGWHMVEHHTDYDRNDWEVAASARRFECGSPNMLGVHALRASISLLLEVGMATVESEVLARARWLFERIRASDPLQLITDDSAKRHAGIVTFRHRHTDSETLFRHLQQHGVVCAARGGGVRFSPHFHTPQETMAMALQIAADLS